MKSSDAFLSHITDYLADEKNIRKDLDTLIYAHYILFAGTSLILFVFRRQLPFPYPHFTLLCLLLLGITTLFHLLTFKKGFPAKMFKSYLYFDTLVAPPIFLFTGGFLTPFVMTHIITIIGTSLINTSNRHLSRNTFTILVTGYLLVALLQKWGILPNYIEYSRAMMQHNLFFYFVVITTVSVMVIGYLLVHILSIHVSHVLDEMKNSFDTILKGTIAETGTNTFDCLARSLNDTLQPRCVLIGELINNGTAVRTVSLWDKGARQPNVDLPVQQSVFADLFKQKKIIVDRNVRSDYPGDVLLSGTEAEFYYGLLLSDSKERALGVLCVIGDRPIRRMYLVDPLATIFSSRAAAELERIRNEEQQKTIEVQLAHAHKMSAIGHLVSGIAHDFNNMINIITGNAQILLKKTDADSPHQRNILHIIDAGRHTSELIGQLTGFARRDTSGATSVDVNNAVNDMVSLLRETITGPITVTIDCIPTPLFVRGNPTQFANMLLNIGINGRDAMKDTPGGVLSYRTTVARLEKTDVLCESFRIDPGEYAVISVADTGTGMTRETLDHLFEPFFTTKQKENGTGLGLANVWGYVQNFKGAVEVKSAPGSGATFSFYFPLEKKSM